MMEKKETGEEQEVKGRGDNGPMRSGIAAFFDLDGTLVPPPSMERRFFRTLRYRKAIPAKNYLLWMREAMRLAPQGINMILQGNKLYLRGVAVGRAGRSGLKPTPEFFIEAIERAAWHARQGHAIVLMSGTVEPLALGTARAMEEELASRGAAVAIRVCATRLEETGGTWTGKILGEAMFGGAKGRAAKRLAAEMKLDMARCFAYGDSASDRWMLEAVGQAGAVNPSRKLARIARRRGWPIMQWQEEKNLAQRTQGEGDEVSGRSHETQGNVHGEAKDEQWESQGVMKEASSRSQG